MAEHAKLDAHPARDAGKEAHAKLDSSNTTTTTTKRVKRFIPLENNPEVLNPLVHKLGLSTSLQFHDVFSIDDPELLSFTPRPAHALLMCFPVSKAYESYREEEDKPKADYDGSGDGEQVIWFRQTIRNACGLYGLLHGVCNGQAREYIAPSSDLAQLIKSAIPLKPEQRADLLEESDSLEAAHASAAQQGDTTAPQLEEEVDIHFVCFVKSANGHLWEMDGTRKGPLDRGAMGADEDVLSEKALDLGPRRFLKREAEAGGGDLRFSLLVLGPAMD